MAEVTSVHSRETRARAREIKFVVDSSIAPRIQDWMRTNLQPDEFGTGPHADEYSTCSLYFETDRFDVFHRRGSYGKSKYRIRRYSMSPVMFLERKFRTDRVLIKRRTLVPVSEFERLDGNSPDAAWDGYWFHRRIVARRLQPLVQLSYIRTARVGMSTHGRVRMTIDFDLR